MPAAAKDVLAAGVVVFRPGRRVLLVHRPKYDDWSFPKGKLDPGEHVAAAAVREVAEETGLHVRLCLPLSLQEYPVQAGHKTVHYWTGRVVGPHDVSGYRPNDEIDDVRWVTADDAAELLTYERDRTTLAEAVPNRRRTRPVVVLRHGQARSRKAWRRDDRDRPLVRAGETQAERLVPLLAAYGVSRVVSSTSLRCVQTVEPYVRTTGWELETRRRLSEEDATPDGVAAVVDDVVDSLDDDVTGAVVCSHRPVLPEVFDALGLADPHLEAGELLVVHLRKGRVAGTERHQAP
ncbi:NUDIX hydrolase [Nocardioides sp. C4-1]|uniref:NUDIX hydrolase n=1 Tax=Nocardioides sp. C4-1 TaxID=3151851 RepID=UPI003266773B